MMQEKALFYIHRWKQTSLSSSSSRLQSDDLVRVIDGEDERTIVEDMLHGRYFKVAYRTFAYVETTEPLDVYASN